MRVREKLGLVKAVCYGPFAFTQKSRALREKIVSDAPLIRQLGANCLRLYEPVDSDVLDELHSQQLGVILTLSWSQHLTFLSDRSSRKLVESELSSQLRILAPHPAIRAVLVGNEIPPDIIRWQGTQQTLHFLDRLIQRVHAKLPNIPVGYATYPTTEFLFPDQADFLAINVFLHDPICFRRYLDHLSDIAHERPVLVTETGFDSLALGEQGQAELYQKILPVLQDSAICGCCFFSFTDEWWRGGRKVTDWHFGLTREDRTPKPAYKVVEKFFAETSSPPTPDASVVPFTIAVCSRNAAPTLPGCLASLERLNPAPQHILLVNDGSTDATPTILQQWAARDAKRRTVMHTSGVGLSSARNLALQHCQTEYIAYCDADCELPTRWLHFLHRAFLQDPSARAAGGPNFAPRSEHPKTSALNSAPGTAGHVLLAPRRAEHLPGCNLALHVATARKLGGFDPQFHTAGDDVDLCWRLLDLGHALAFHPGAWLWHLRRSSWRTYWKQQYGYGQAEAMLWHKHPHRFTRRGNAIWNGVIYPLTGRIRPADAGRFGLSAYQCLYPAEVPKWSEYFTRSTNLFAATLIIIYGALLLIFQNTLNLVDYNSQRRFFMSLFPYLPHIILGFGIVVLTAMISAVAKLALTVPLRSQNVLASRLRLMALYLTQRWQRSTGRKKKIREISSSAIRRLEKVAPVNYWEKPPKNSRWDENGIDRTEILAFLEKKLDELGFIVEAPTQHTSADLRIILDEDTTVEIRAVTEWHQGGKTLNKIRVAQKTAPLSVLELTGFFVLPIVSIVYLDLDNWLVLVLGLLYWLGYIHLGRIDSIRIERKNIYKLFQDYRKHIGSE